MSFDFNKQGEEYTYFAAKAPQEDCKVLPDRPRKMLETLRALLAEEYQVADTSRQRWLLNAAGCLDRLKGFLLQVRRVAEYGAILTQNVLTLPGQPENVQLSPGTMITWAADEACFDFESLLFHARAALDRVTWFVAARYKQRCDRFSKLRRILKPISQHNDQARLMVAVLDEAGPFGGLLTDEEGAKALRSVVAHQRSMPEGREIAFTIHILPDGRRLIFDCEALGQPLFATAQRLSMDVPFVMLNSVAIYMGQPTLPHSEFRVTWVNPTAVFSEHIDASGHGLRLTVASVYPSGINLKTRHMLPSVFDHAFVCDSPLIKRMD
jgi:hypothetical protein